MASKSTAPTLRTTSALRKKEEDEATTTASTTTARAAELFAAISQATQQVAMATSEATARILRGEAHAERERFDKQLGQLQREQVDFIVASSAPT